MPKDPKKMHWYVVLTDPVDDPVLGKCVGWASGGTVNGRRGDDRTCLLGQGDHPKISQDSLIDYRRTEVISVAKLESLIASGEVKDTRKPMKKPVLDRIVQGLSRCGRSSRAIRFCIANRPVSMSPSPSTPTPRAQDPSTRPKQTTNLDDVRRKWHSSGNTGSPPEDALSKSPTPQAPTQHSSVLENPTTTKQTPDGDIGGLPKRR
jgi:hypothetical protein